MSILNTANDGLYNILIVLFQTITKYRDIPRKDLVDLCAPFEDQEKINQTLKTWIELELILENKTLSLSPEYIPEINDEIKQKLPAILRKIVFKKENNEDFWNDKQSRSADFSRALSWLLCQDIYSTQIIDHREAQKLESDQFRNFPKVRAFNNDVTFIGFKSWAGFLGFTKGSEKLHVDFSSVIKDELKEIFLDQQQLKQSTFLERLRSKLPVIDGGELRLKVESEIQDNKIQKSNPEYLSTSLSMNLLKLENEGYIELVKLSDFETVCTLKGKNRDLKTFSHVNIISRN